MSKIYIRKFIRNIYEQCNLFCTEQMNRNNYIFPSTRNQKIHLILKFIFIMTYFNTAKAVNVKGFTILVFKIIIIIKWRL